jgi:tRNA(adenine34) deaminase
MTTAPDDIRLMQLAIEQARLALQVDEIPIGCVILHEPTGNVIASAYNRRHIDKDPTAHAELLAMRQAAAVLNRWQLNDCTLYVTLEPCPMCAGGLVNARIRRLVYGCTDPKGGAVQTLYTITTDPRLNHRLEVSAGLLADDCAQLLTTFFRTQRALGKK